MWGQKLDFQRARQVFPTNSFWSFQSHRYGPAGFGTEACHALPLFNSHLDWQPHKCGDTGGSDRNRALPAQVNSMVAAGAFVLPKRVDTARTQRSSCYDKGTWLLRIAGSRPCTTLVATGRLVVCSRKTWAGMDLSSIIKLTVLIVTTAMFIRFTIWDNAVKAGLVYDLFHTLRYPSLSSTKSSRQEK